MKTLTLEDFKMDYQHLAIRYAENTHMHMCREMAAKIIIREHYPHLTVECSTYLESRETACA